MNMHDFVAAGEAKLASLDTVVESVLALVDHLIEGARQNVDDPAEMSAFLDHIEAEKQKLAAAVVTGTQAEGETPAPQTGGEDSQEGAAAADSPAGGAGEDTVEGGAGDNSIEGGAA